MSMIRATHTHLESLLDLMTEFHAESGYPLNRGRAATAFSPLLADDRTGQVWIMEETGAPAGYVVVTFGYSMEHAGALVVIDDLYVRPSFRNRGLAAHALRHVRDDCRGRGVRAILVETGHESAAALAVYRRAGFVIVDRLHLTLPLAPPSHEDG